jgi:tetratricopeptide (TPR) repeat protein
MRIIILSLIFTQLSFAAKKDGLDKLVDKVGLDQALSTQELISLKDLKLDNPFIVHLYTQLLTNKHLTAESKKLFMQVIKKEHKAALTSLSKLNNSDQLHSATQVYLFYQLGHFHYAMDAWVQLAKRAGFLNSPLQVTLDQILANDIDKKLVKEHYFLSSAQKEILDQLPENKSVVFKNIIPLAHLNQGPKSLEYIKNLPLTSPIRIELAKSAVISFAKAGELAKAASVLKKVFKPYMEKSDQVDELVDYYLMLARLLYQANAFDSSLHYYSLIPESSKRFLQARIESLWISYIQDDFSRLKGQVKSLEDTLLADKFMPELYLMSSSAKVKLCQFESAKQTIDQFITIYKDWANKIELHINSGNPELIESTYRWNLYTAGLQRIMQEEQALVGMKLNEYLNSMKQKKSEASKILVSEKMRQWKNRKVILSNIIRKMRFVKVEYISLMKRFRDKAISKKADEVHLYQAKSRANDEIEFPYDGDLWGDDYFNLKAQTESACIQGMR